MELRDIEIFLAVNKFRHFGRAAEDLHLSQPTISKSLKRLEREIGGKLFERSNHGVDLTDLGESVLSEVTPTYDALLDAVERVHRYAAKESSQLIIGCFTEAGLEITEKIPRLIELWPDIRVNLAMLRTRDQIPSLREGKVHVCYCWAPEVASDLASVPIRGARHVAVVPACHRLFHRTSLQLSDLRGEQLLLCERSVSPNAHDALAAGLSQSALHWMIVGTSSLSIASSVMSGEGIGILLNYPSQHRVDGLKYIEIEDSPIVEQFLVWRRAHPHPALEALIEVLRDTDREPAAVRGYPAPSSHRSASTAPHKRTLPAGR